MSIAHHMWLIYLAFENKKQPTQLPLVGYDYLFSFLSGYNEH